jgi:hypothetical protein
MYRKKLEVKKKLKKKPKGKNYTTGGAKCL